MQHKDRFCLLSLLSSYADATMWESLSLTFATCLEENKESVVVGMYSSTITNAVDQEGRFNRSSNTSLSDGASQSHCFTSFVTNRCVVCEHRLQLPVPRNG